MGMYDDIVNSLINDEVNWELDPSIELHETYEIPTWDLFKRLAPSLLRWLTPQFSYEAILGDNNLHHWVDFLLCSPFLNTSCVIEIDGEREYEDEDRVENLKDKGIRAFRVKGRKVLEEDEGFCRWVSGEANGTELKPSKYLLPTEKPSLDLMERSQREGWDVEYTTIGGRLRSSDPYEYLDESNLIDISDSNENEREKIKNVAKERVKRLTSQVFIATSFGKRSQDPDSLYWVTVCQKILQRSDRPFVTPRTEELLRLEFSHDETSIEEGGISERLVAPFLSNRFAFAITKAVHAGHLTPGNTWKIELEDPTGLVEASAGGTFDLLAAIDVIWSTGIVPNEIVVNQTCWMKEGNTFNKKGGSGSNSTDLKIVLDPYSPPHARLPEVKIPTIILRSAFLPLRPSWSKALSNERRDIVPSTKIDDALKIVLKALFTHDEFREGQLDAINRKLTGKDTAVMLPTGTGKSLIFQIVGLLRPGVTLSVDPLVSLINDQSRVLKKEGIDRVADITGASLSGGSAYLDQLSRGDFIFAFLTPERLHIETFREKLKWLTENGTLINLVVVDESHCVSEWGHDFRTPYLNVSSNLRNFCADETAHPPPVLALTATASPSVRRDMLTELDFNKSDPNVVQTPASHDRPNLHLSISLTSRGNNRQLLSEIVFETIPQQLGKEPSNAFEQLGENSNSIIVFVPHVNGRFGIDQIREFLKNEADRRELNLGIGYYGGQPRSFQGSSSDWEIERQNQADDFINNRNLILVATKGFGMGIDKPNIRGTVHYGIPGSIEAFAQEYGRAGRDGRNSYCHLLADVNGDHEKIMEIFDNNKQFLERRTLAREARNRLPLNIDQQTYFHYGSSDRDFNDGSFCGVEKELESTRIVFDEIFTDEQSASGGQIRIRNDTFSEKAIFRLSSLGMIEDYTIMYYNDASGTQGGGGFLTIMLNSFSKVSIDNALRKRGVDMEPGRGDALEREISSAPSELRDRCLHHIRLFIEMLYRNIEPGRVRALEEMYSLSVSGLDSDDLSTRINAYLGGGIIGTNLDRILFAQQENATNELLLSILHEIKDLSGNEKRGVTGGQLTRTGEHPVALLAAASAYVSDESEDREEFKRLTKQAFNNFQSYVSEKFERETMFRSFREYVSTRVTKQDSWAGDLWELWPEERLEEIYSYASELMDSRSWHNTEELNQILNLLLSVGIKEATNFSLMQTGGSS